MVRKIGIRWETNPDLFDEVMASYQNLIDNGWIKPHAPIVKYPEEPDPDEPFKGIVVDMSEVTRPNRKRGCKQRWNAIKAKEGGINRGSNPSLGKFADGEDRRNLKEI